MKNVELKASIVGIIFLSLTTIYLIIGGQFYNAVVSVIATALLAVITNLLKGELDG